MLVVVAAWLLLFILITLLGMLGMRVVFGKKLGEISWYDPFWVGLTLMVVLLEFFSIFYPVGKYFWVLILVADLVGLILFRDLIKNTYYKLKKTFTKPKPKHKLFIAFFVFFLITVAYSASRTVVWYDSNLYHLNAVKWISDFKIVPGLANLDTHLGFNSSFFLFAAAANNWFLADKAAHIALSLIVIVALFQWIYSIIFYKKDNLFVSLFCLGTLPVLIQKIWANELPSLSTDLSTLVVFLVMCFYLLNRSKKHLFMAGLLAALVSVFKLSGLVAGAIIFVYMLYSLLVSFLKKRKTEKPLVWSMFILSLTIIGFIIRNVFTSGWILYPLTYFGNTHLPWSSLSEVANASAWEIKAWSRAPGVSQFKVANMTFIQWFEPWFEDFKTQPEFKLLLVSLVCSLLILVFEKLSPPKVNRGSYKLILLVCLLNLALWFYQAPDLRFADHYFWVLFGINFASLAFYLLKTSGNTGWVIVYSTILLISISRPGFSPRISQLPNFGILEKDPSYPLKEVIIELPNENPLTVYTGIKEGRCGNSRLPCTSEVRPIKEIVPGDISKGFIPMGSELIK